ncbi:MAG: multidrug ABC transporter [Butyrivibrio sp.]|nr:multidrug ABC transporter [Butyrivibrio sp.]
MINVFFFLMLLSELIAATSQVLLKKSAQKNYPSVIREYLNVLVISGYGLLVLAMVITIFCYEGLSYMGVVVMEPVGYIIVMIMSRIFFNEKMTPRKLLGVAFILAGIAVFFGLG